MLVKINSCARFGVDCVSVTIEVNISSYGMPYFDLIGLTSKEIDESKYRIKNAIQNSGIEFPESRIVVNMAPADIPKEGSLYDFAIAAGIISYVTGRPLPEKSLFFGELSMDGSLCFTKGSFLLGLYAKKNNFTKIFLPVENVDTVLAFSGLDIYPVRDLKSFYAHLLEENKISVCEKNRQGNSKGVDAKHLSMGSNTCPNDFSQVIGQLSAKRALKISAAGSHNLIMVGSPGVGKTMLAKAYQTILPELSEDESIQTTRIHSSYGGVLVRDVVIKDPPFRSPHHTISYGGMIGGGSNPKPGEISLAHNGVLFMDEFTEFPRNILESLRQPIEDGEVSISRIKYNFKFPCRFVLIAACNPCPCGYYGSSKRKCTCSPRQIEIFRKKLSGPIIDRIDIYINVGSVEEGVFLQRRNMEVENQEESSTEIKKQVLMARKIQFDRGTGVNSYMSAENVKKYCRPEKEAEEILNSAVKKYSLSMRSYIKLLKISRTVADLEGKDTIEVKHVIEALVYKFKSYTSMS